MATAILLASAGSAIGLAAFGAERPPCQTANTRLLSALVPLSPPPLLCCLHTGGALQASVRTVPLVRTTRPISDCALLTVLPSLFAPFQQLLLAVPQLFHHEDRRLPVPSPSCADNCGDVACISAQRMGPSGRVRQGMAPKSPLQGIGTRTYPLLSFPTIFPRRMHYMGFGEAPQCPLEKLLARFACGSRGLK